MDLILVRHGETDANRQGVLMGSMGGPSLNSTGRGQAAEIGEALKAEPVVQLYTSPAWRAKETAEIISQVTAAPFSEVYDLREIDVGRLEGLTQPEVRENFGAHSLEWEKDPASARHPGGETMEELQGRAWNVVQGLSAKHAGETIVVVSHLFTILAVMTRLLDMPLRHFRRISLEPGAMARIEVSQGKFQVISTNETWHLSIRGQDSWASADNADSPG
jgi:broad specificity phosphatase PhoE